MNKLIKVKQLSSVKYIAIFIFLATVTTNAQKVKFGVKTGLNISNIVGSDEDTNNLFNFHVGLTSEFEISEFFSIQPEIIYSRQGSEVSNEAKLKLDYLNIPIITKFYVSENFSLDFGPQFSFLTSDKVQFLDISDGDLETDAPSFDFGLGLGFGYNIKESLLFQMRYVHGITTVSESPDLKNTLFQISLAYLF